jgi:hypothetical protein
MRKLTSALTHNKYTKKQKPLQFERAPYVYRAELLRHASQHSIPKAITFQCPAERDAHAYEVSHQLLRFSQGLDQQKNWI